MRFCDLPPPSKSRVKSQSRLTGIVAAKIFSLATVLFALGSEVGFHRTILTRLQNKAEDLLSCPQGYRLKQNRERRLEEHAKGFATTAAGLEYSTLLFRNTNPVPPPLQLYEY